MSVILPRYQIAIPNRHHRQPFRHSPAAISPLAIAILPLQPVVCSTSLMASLIRSVGGLSKCFYQGLWLAVLSADVIGQSINRLGLPRSSLIMGWFLLPFLHDFCMDFHTDSRGHGRPGRVLPLCWVIWMCRRFDPLFWHSEDWTRSFWGIFSHPPTPKRSLGY